MSRGRGYLFVPPQMSTPHVFLPQLSLSLHSFFWVHALAKLQVFEMQKLLIEQKLPVLHEFVAHSSVPHESPLPKHLLVFTPHALNVHTSLGLHEFEFLHWSVPH